MPSKKSTKVVAASLDPCPLESLAFFNLPRRARCRLRRRRGGLKRDESHIPGRSCARRAEGGAGSSWRRRRGRRAPIRPRLRGSNSNRRDSPCGRSGRSCPVQRASRSVPPSALLRHARRSGFPAGTRRGRRDSFSMGLAAGAPRAARRATAPRRHARPEAAPKATSLNVPDDPSAAAGARPTQRRGPPEQRQTRSFWNCAGSSKLKATKTRADTQKPGTRGDPGFSCGALMPEAQSFLTASVSAGTVSKRSATRK